MDREGQHSVHSSSEQRQPYRRSSNTSNTSNFQQNTTSSSQQPNTKSSIPQNHDNPTIPNQSPLPPIPLGSLKNIPQVTPHFTVPPLPLSRRRSASPDTRFSPNPARQVFSYPVSYPQDAPSEYSMSQEDGPPPSQRRRLSSPENRGRNLRSDEDSDSRRGSASKGAMSYDPVHEYHQAQHQHHSRRPSSAASQHSHISSYSAQSSNLGEDEAMSPIIGDHQPVSRDGKKRKHKCQECGQYFTRLHNLKSHLLTHSQEKPFICQTCGHKFRRLHDLKRSYSHEFTNYRPSQITHRRKTLYLSRM
jgi:DNA-directed RNA polymerase subunit M/transcription elongation factor TFIIS